MSTMKPEGSDGEGAKIRGILKVGFWSYQLLKVHLEGPTTS